MAHLTQQLEWITVGQTDFSPLETSPGFYRPFVLPPHTVGSTVITKEEEKTTKIAIIIIVVVVIIKTNSKQLRQYFNRHLQSERQKHHWIA